MPSNKKYHIGSFTATIGGGFNNTASGCYSSILGGSGNADSGYNYAGIFGCNIAAVAANTFHVGCLNACSAYKLMSNAVTLPICTVYAYTGVAYGGITGTAYPLYIIL